MVFRYRLRDARGDLLPRFLNRRATGSVPDNVTNPASYWTLGLIIFCLCVLFSHLGTAVLFEPDEGRNAEIAREILLLKDWVTPHYDFIPRLDKPISYFWLVALSFRLFGLSEWSAPPTVRLGGVCLSIRYLCARSRNVWPLGRALERSRSADQHRVFCFFPHRNFGHAAHFFFTLALCTFFWGQPEVLAGKRRLYFLQSCMLRWARRPSSKGRSVSFFRQR